MKAVVDFAVFEQLDIRIGTIVQAELNGKARSPSFLMQIDFGSRVGIRKTSAQMTANYDPASVIGLQVTAIINLPPKQIGGSMSEVLVLGVRDKEAHAVLITPDRAVPNGAAMF